MSKRGWTIYQLSEEESRRYHDPFGEYANRPRSQKDFDDDLDCESYPPSDYYKTVYEMYDDFGNLIGNTTDRHSLEQIIKAHNAGDRTYERFMSHYGYGSFGRR